MLLGEERGTGRNREASELGGGCVAGLDQRRSCRWCERSFMKSPQISVIQKSFCLVRTSYKKEKNKLVAGKFQEGRTSDTTFFCSLNSFHRTGSCSRTLPVQATHVSPPEQAFSPAWFLPLQLPPHSVTPVATSLGAISPAIGGHKI